ncbi:MAG: phytoene/squalene synthase family protein [Nakamurella sp.]
MSQRVEAELDAAGITDPLLRNDYRLSRELAREHGRTYFLATRFLPADRRSAVHALYGFARTADDIVDDPSPSATTALKTARLQEFSDSMAAPDRAHPTVRAALHAARRFDLDPELFTAFLESMRMDLTVHEYATHDELDRYVWGSAAVIGLMVTPVMGTVSTVEEAAPYAADLGIAFQLSNFIRDVGEDLRLGRIYLPMESLRRFGLDRERLQRKVVDDDVRGLLAAEIDRTRAIYRRAEPGIAMLAPGARGCVRVAFQLYGDILGAVERADYQVFGPRIRVSRRRRAAIAGRVIRGAARSKLSGGSGGPTTPTTTSSA